MNSNHGLIRVDMDKIVDELKELGADVVITDDQMRTRETENILKELGGPPKLALNCVGGINATNLARLLG